MSRKKADWNRFIIRLMQLDLEQLVRWPIYWQVLLLVIMSFAVQAFIGWFLVIPKMDEIEDISHRRVKTERMIESYREQLKALPLLQQDIIRQSHQLREFLNALLDENSLSTLIASITQVSNQTNIQIVHIRWGIKEPFEFLDKVPIDIELRGHYKDLIAFSQAIAELKSVVVFDNFKLNKANSKNGVLKATITAYTFLNRSKESSDEQK